MTTPDIGQATSAMEVRALERWLSGEGVARFDVYAAATEATLSADDSHFRLRDQIARAIAP